jgi:non-homologous end joining protein Ku
LASRPTWSGLLHINAFLEAHISLVKGTEDYRGREGLVEVCACHQKPFKRSAVCVEGFTRLTQQMEKGGETDGTTPAVKSVPNGEDSWVVLDDDTIAAIEGAGTSDTITIAAMMDPESVPLERTSGMYYVIPNKKVKGSSKAVELLYEVLTKTGKIVVAKWAPRGREMLVAIRPVDEKLIASVLLFEPEIRDAAPYTLTARTVSAEETELAVQLLERLPSRFDFAAAVDEAVGVRQQAIEAARAGKPVPVKAPTPSTESAPDLMAQLRAALDATPAPDAEQVPLAAAAN